MGVAVRASEKAVGGGGAMTCQGAAFWLLPDLYYFGTFCPKHKSTEALSFRAKLGLTADYICAAFATGNGGRGKFEINNSCPCVRTREAQV